MGQVSPEQFARALQDLDGPAFAALVADLWERTGWETDLDGQQVVATRRGETRRLHAVPPRRFASLRGLPSAAGDVDALVVPHRTTAAGGSTDEAFDGELLDATDLRERALYALDDSARESFFQRHFGRPANDPSWQEATSLDAVPSSLRALASPLWTLSSSLRELPSSVRRSSRLLRSPAGPGSPLDRARESTAARTVAVAVLVLGAVLAAAAVVAGPLADDDPVEQNQSRSDDLVSAATVAETNDPAYDVEPTCERGPREVATTVSAALTGGDIGRALSTYWDFSNPSYREQTGYGAFASIHRSSYESIVDAEHVEHGEPREIEDGRVRINATVVHGSGETSDWTYELQRWSEEPQEGCWVVNTFARQ